METFLGYYFVRFNPNSAFFPSFNANGGGGQFVYNFNQWVGGVVDLGAVTAGSLGGSNIDSTVINLVAGPRVTYRNGSRFQPFAHLLFGGAYSTASVPVGVPQERIILPTGPAVTTRLVASNTGFAMLLGGGVDIKVGDHITVRPIGADYYLTRLPNPLTGNNTNQNNFRYSAGISFVLGTQ